MPDGLDPRRAAAALAADILLGLHPLSPHQALALFDLLRALTIELDHEYGELIYRAAQKQKRQHARRRPAQLNLPLNGLDVEPF